MVLSGCRTGGVFLKETPLNASDTRKVVVSVIGVPISTNDNGRELVSKFHDKTGKEIEKPTQVKRRYFTRVSILGDRRPYDIQVEVFYEQKDAAGKYVIINQDYSLAEERANQIMKLLNEGRDRRNVIDDFKPY
jgi:hypothetical protein